MDHCSALHARDDTSCSVGRLPAEKGCALDLQEQITFVDFNLQGLTMSVRVGVPIKCMVMVVVMGMVMVMGSTLGWEGGAKGMVPGSKDAKRGIDSTIGRHGSAPQSITKGQSSTIHTTVESLARYARARSV